MKKLLVFLCAILLVFGVVGVAGAAPTEFITNGDFETGDLTGWGHTPNAVAVENNWWEVNSYEGSYMAVLAPFGVLDANLWQSISGFDPSVYPEVTITFAYNIKAVDWNKHDYNMDYLELTANGFKLFQLPFNELFDGWGNVQEPTELGWLVFSETYPIYTITGPITFNFHLENIPPGGGEFLQSTVAYIDAISVSAEPVPEPATMLLLGSGLIGLAGLGRKKFFKKS